MQILSLQQRIQAFVQLGNSMKVFVEHTDWPGFSCGLTEDEFNSIHRVINTNLHFNAWFTPGEIKRSLTGLAYMLRESSIQKWIKEYDLNQSGESKTVGVIMAGNIPMVGFHDFLSVVMTGNKALLKLSSDDDKLLPAFIEVLLRIEPGFADQIELVDGKMSGFQAVIATGSNNTSRYFREYFGKYPHIIRKNRNSVAVLVGDESEEEIQQLGEDIFAFYGLGCRNVTKMFLPVDYDINHFFAGIYKYGEVVNHNKYANNYDYHKAIWLMNQDKLLDNGFLLVKDDPNIASPIGTLYTQRYTNKGEIEEILNAEKENIQCVVGKEFIPFGKAQKPELWDYADDVDTVDFLLSLK